MFPVEQMVLAWYRITESSLDERTDTSHSREKEAGTPADTFRIDFQTEFNGFANRLTDKCPKKLPEIASHQGQKLEGC